MSGRTTEVLVLTASAVALPTTPLFFRRSVTVQNLGPNPIFVAFSSAAAVATKAHRLAQYDTLSVNGESFELYAITTSANQVTGAATIVSEVSL
jgi:hypothetical protein